MGQLPPLKALRAFAAVSQHLSVSKAAAELFVTPAAVSHQLKILEAFLGVELLRRTTRQVTLTPAGEQYANSVVQAINQLQESTHRLLSSEHELHVTTEPTFLMYGLMPHMQEFEQRFPGLKLSVSTSYEKVNLATSPYDCAVRWSVPAKDTQPSILLPKQKLVPICNPQFLAGQVIKKPADLLEFQLLGGNGKYTYPSWQMYLQQLGLAVDQADIKHYENSFVLIQAALAGQGIALDRLSFAKPFIERGQLIQCLPDFIAETTTGYYVVTQAECSDKVSQFAAWLQEWM